jgi:hypothetical protein
LNAGSSVALRLPALFVLAVQLAQPAAPALCMPRERAAPCHRTTSGAAPELVAAAPAHAMPCAQSALCAAPAAGLPGTAVGFATPGTTRGPVPVPDMLDTLDRLPPPAPPPQA